MVQPQVIHPNVQVNDITRQFRSAVSTLLPGALVKDEHFTLFEAVSALEIGDPKMDSGSVAFDPDTEAEFDFAATSSPEEILWLMDELSCREVAWHKGHPLSQTLFTSLHIERLLWPEPKRLADARFFREHSPAIPSSSLLENVFRPFCLGMIKACDLVLEMVMGSHYYEEEDFATQIFNTPLLHIFQVDEILSELQRAKLFLTQSELGSDVRTALLARIEVRGSFLELLRTSSTCERPSAALINRCISLLSEIEATTDLGRCVTVEAFTPKTQRKLASSVPPRPMVAIARADAFPFFRRLISDIYTAFNLLDVSFSADLLIAYHHFMAQENQPAVYVRSLVQSFLYLDNSVLGHSTPKEFILQDLRTLVFPVHPLLCNSPSEIFTDRQFDAATQFDIFIERTADSFLNLFRAFCLNRPRVRRTMCHAVLEWDQIQLEAEDLDGQIQSAFDERPIPYTESGDDEPTFSYSLSSWVYHYKLIQLRTIVQMGFELSIYAPHEFKLILFTWLKATDSLAKSLHRVFVILERHKLLVKPRFPYSSDELRYEVRMRPFRQLSIPQPIGEDVARQASSLDGLGDQEVLDQAAAMNQVSRRAWEEVLKQSWHSEPLLRPSSSSSSQQQQQGAPRSENLSEDVVEQEWTKDVKNGMKSCIGTGIAISTLTKALEGGGTVIDPARIKVDFPVVGERERWHVAWVVPKIRSVVPS
ncbi:N-alpha-acetyltransferase, non-catalitic subunit [Exophiala oligosperma]